MTPKQYLMQVSRAERELQVINARRRHYIELATSFGGIASAVGKKPGHSSKTETAAVGLIDMTSELDEKAREYTALIREAEAMIAKIPQENYRKILTLRYLVGMSFRSISDEMRYTDRGSVYRAHGYALLEMGKVMKDAG